ncbi:MAG TPA: preprotein translocase subunit YajC [Candidatus Omnitrophota bacterium]|nr:preprotein translocase subunit YajC [Candidatus Omnitrophota bacterium]
MLVSPAFAQAAAPAGGQDMLTSFLPLILIFVVFYFLLIRPQQKRMKAHKELLASLRRGDRVVTSGGIIGVVNKVVSDTEVILEIADNVKVRVVRATIQDIMDKTQPVAAGKDEAEPEKPADK